ncbi:MAG: Na/Pi cotransporter family protein [Candidatus Dadabacteria bacterium]|nr:Na/Pi cotransporter family protein [Candidatus Dadabacteria bacterium]
MILMGLLGGLAIFLFGMDQMTDALKAVMGEGMSKLLAGLTRNRFTATITGAITTAVIQSSTVTTVIVIGFISVGLMTLQQVIGVILGANIGSTITAQIIAFNVTQYALLPVAVGFGMQFVSKNEKIRLYGGIIMGLGLVFFGMGIMSSAANPLRSYEPFVEVMREMSNPILGITAGLVFTGLIQSSAATIGIVIVLASQGAITLGAGIAIVLGANVGTCLTALLAAMGKPAPARQAAAAHILFNVIGVIIWLPFIGQLASLAEAVSPVSAGLSGTERLAADTPRQIANAHTLFNVANTILFIGVIGPFARFIQWLVPEKPEPLPEYAQPVYLDDSLLQTPALAIERIRLEAVRLGGYVDELMEMARPVVLYGGAADLERVVSRGKELRRLHDAITDYARRLFSSELTLDETRRLEALIIVTVNLDHVAETIAVNMVSLGRERLERRFAISGETAGRFQPYASGVREAYLLALKALDSKDAEAAAAVIEMKADIDRMSEEIVEHLSARLLSDDPDRAVLYRVESRLVELIQRIYYFSHMIAGEILKESEARKGDGEAYRKAS